MLTLVVVCVLAIALLAYYLHSKGRDGQKYYLARREILSTLGGEELRDRATKAISGWSKVLNTPEALAQIPKLGVLTAEFMTRYAEIVSPNGAHRLGLTHLGQSVYQPKMLTIGKSDYLEICVLPTADAVYVIDGSETDEILEDQYPSVMHLLIDYGEFPNSK